MFTLNSIRILCICAVIVAANCEIKIWFTNASDHWEHSGSNKCGTTKAVLSKQLDGVFYMNSRPEQSINEFVLPLDGAVVVPDTFALPLSNGERCTEDDYMVMKQSAPQSWFDPENWNMNVKSQAKPHIDRIPCECDEVIILPITGVSIDLEFVDEILARSIVINQHEADFNQFLETRIGQRMFTNTEAVRYTPGVCSPPRHRACHSHEHFHEYLGLVCQHVTPKCPTPHCLKPIQPIGHCCSMCGAIMEIRIREQPDDFQFDKLQQLILTKMKRFRNGRYANALEYYVGFVSNNKANDKLVQMVVAEPEEYTGISLEFMTYISKDPKFQGKLINSSYAGIERVYISFLICKF